MSTSEQPRTRRPSLLRLLAAQVVYQLRLLIRSPMASFATLVIPLMVLLAVNLLYAGTRLSDRGNILYAQFFTPAMVAFAVVNACYMSVISSTTLARDAGILKRIRSTPLPSWIYMAGRLVAAGVVAACAAIVVIAVGAGLYSFEIVWSAIPAVLATIGLAIFCFCALGLAVTVLVPAADSALPIAWGTILPLCFISDVFQPIDNAPGWLRAIASVFPLRPFADALQTAFNPIVGSRTIQWGHLGVLAGWGLAAAVFALVAFRWEPDDSRHHREREPRRPARFGAVRVHGLLQAHGQPASPERTSVQPSISAKPAPPRTEPPPGVATAPMERIEGPAPAEDSSIPQEPAGR
jgi:ABC-2 type transport system permease protein